MQWLDSSNQLKNNWATLLQIYTQRQTDSRLETTPSHSISSADLDLGLSCPWMDCWKSYWNYCDLAMSCCSSSKKGTSFESFHWCWVCCILKSIPIRASISSCFCCCYCYSHIEYSPLCLELNLIEIMILICLMLLFLVKRLYFHCVRSFRCQFTRSSHQSSKTYHLLC